MPIYEYNEGQRVVERVLPAERRDDYPNRITVPRRISVCPRGQISQGDEVTRGFYKVEQQLGARGGVSDHLKKAFGMTAGQIRDVWKD